VSEKHPRLLTLKQIEVEYGLPYHTVYELIVKGELPAVRIPNTRIRVKRVDIEQVVERWTGRAA
jgi:excisionase family DNA binding protein